MLLKMGGLIVVSHESYKQIIGKTEMFMVNRRRKAIRRDNCRHLCLLSIAIRHTVNVNTVSQWIPSFSNQILNDRKDG